MSDGTTLATYQAVMTGAAVYDENAYGRIRMRGKSSADLLHRLSTNDIVKLQPGQGARTVVTTPIGRIMDVLTVYARENELLLVTGPGQGGPVFSHLRKNIFFNDQVTLEPLARSHAQLALYGLQAAALLEQLFQESFADLPLYSSRVVTFGDTEVVVGRQLPLGEAGFRLLVPAESSERVQVALREAGAAELDAPTFDVLRVEQGYGANGRELSLEYIPLETGLVDAISFSKGCYVGQEIIARMESRNRLAKQLRGLKLTRDGQQPSADEIAPLTAGTTKLVVDGKDAGDLTSVVVSPRYGSIGLAYVRSAHAEQHSHVGITGSPLIGEVVELPFT